MQPQRGSLCFWQPDLGSQNLSPASQLRFSGLLLSHSRNHRLLGSRCELGRKPAEVTGLRLYAICCQYWRLNPRSTATSPIPPPHPHPTRPALREGLTKLPGLLWHLPFSLSPLGLQECSTVPSKNAALNHFGVLVCLRN